MENEMYQWLENSIKEYYQFIRVLKKESDKELLEYRHKELGKTIVVKKFGRVLPVYEKLVGVRHPVLVDVLEAVTNENATLVLEEYVDGISIAELLETNPFSAKTAGNIAKQICDGLFALHTHRVIHRDIKPENVWMLPDGSVKLMDFDAARIYRESERKDTVVLGTIGYAAPEQYGEAQTDERTDIYALGILMNVMLTGKHPAHTMAEGKIGDIIEKCIMVNPKRRYRNVMDVKEQLNICGY